MTRRPKIAAALITKDSIAVIEACLASIRGAVDEVVVYDTGSTDGTVELLETRAEVRVVRGEWRDDFSWARQRSFELVPADADWVVWLDDDDVVVGAEELRKIVASTQPEIDALLVRYDYAQNEDGRTVVQLWRERVVRFDRGFRWHGVVHETLRLPDDRAPAVRRVPPERLHVLHRRPPERQKGDRNLDLLRTQLARAGDTVPASTLAYLAAEYMARERWADAIPLLERYLDRAEGTSDERAQAFHRLARCRLLAGDAEGAVKTELASLAERDDWGESAAGLTEAYAALDRWDLVERWARRTLELGMPKTTLPLNPLEFTLVPMLHLAEACFRTGRKDEGTEWLGRAWSTR